MRIDAAATQPVFGRLCHQLIGIAGHVRKGPSAKHSLGGCALAVVPGRAVESDEGGAGVFVGPVTSLPHANREFGKQFPYELLTKQTWRQLARVASPVRLLGSSSK